MEKILINIVTHNSRDIFSTLDYLKEAIGDDPKFQVVVFDNNSDKAFITKLQTYSFIDLRESKENLGFGYGHNQVFLHTQQKYGIICNPDILVSKEALTELVALIKENEVAAVVPKVLNSDHSTQHLVRKQLTVFDYFLRFVPFRFVKKVFAKRLAEYECQDLPEDKLSYIRMGSGCFMVIDIDKYKAINGFDEDFFMYFEDNDLCLRFEKAGEKILYTPFVSVIHLYGKGSHKSIKLFCIFMQSMKRFFTKWGWRFF